MARTMAVIPEDLEIAMFGDGKSMNYLWESITHAGGG